MLVVKPVDFEQILYPKGISQANLMFMVPYILVMYIFVWKSNEMHMDLYVFFISLCLLYMLRVLFAHHQELKLQRTAVGTRDCFDVWEVG
jgi:hypothetical protein